MGDVLNIKLILEVNKEGRIVPREKARVGVAINAFLEIMAAEGRELYSQLITIGYPVVRKKRRLWVRRLKAL